MSSIAIRQNAGMLMIREIIMGEAEPLLAKESTSFDYFTAVDLRLSDPNEREELSRSRASRRRPRQRRRAEKLIIMSNSFDRNTLSANKGRNKEKLTSQFPPYLHPLPAS
ncbi:hypothetical protein CGCSCA4_v012913 [Colletotrichum siamense]|uniref:Uncharacterized protein n=1 Tax=Colletotrichum siamense TaxID=690259 RepID=A0A9P5BQD7_COLSI|nr:hypothetical protein CGCSCA4_v012913 [Colletotrichum siamense]KAF4848758.1 hypothetical protein CGCSCA2_v012228 [Colletotrichum siamense]